MDLRKAYKIQLFFCLLFMVGFVIDNYYSDKPFSALLSWETGLLLLISFNCLLNLFDRQKHR